MSLKKISKKGIDPDIYRLLNFIQFATPYSNDLNIATYEVSDPKLYNLEWEILKLFHTKILVLIIFEMLEDFAGLLPKPMYQVVKKFDVKGEFDKQLKELHSELNEIRKKDYEYLKNIRNKISAHKHKDASQQISIIRGIDTIRVVNVADKLRDWLTRVLKLLPPILFQFHNGTLQELGFGAKMLKKKD
ncbi:MAG: hypothetical protein WBD99_14255 [Thermodesulfobacteriota bacterium]